MTDSRWYSWDTIERDPCWFLHNLRRHISNIVWKRIGQIHCTFRDHEWRIVGSFSEKNPTSLYYRGMPEPSHQAMGSSLKQCKWCWECEEITCSYGEWLQGSKW